MRFLLLNQFYPPDMAPTGWYLHHLARELARRGHEVNVLCSQRSYDGAARFPRRETMDGVAVTRLPATGFGRGGAMGKLADYASFYGTLAGELLRNRPAPDLVLCLTSPPYLGLLGKAAAWKSGGRHAHWIMDLYPDVMFAGKPRNGFAARFLRALARYQFRGAGLIVALGPKMAECASAYAPARGHEPAVCSIPLWSDPALAQLNVADGEKLRAQRGWSQQETVFLYSGNMGLGHRFGEFLEIAKRLGADGVRWVFSGGGKRRPEIENFARRHPNLPIQFLGYAPQEHLAAHLASADVHLASMDAAWDGFMVPSKLQGSFAVGRPVLFVGGSDCETALWIKRSSGGWAVKQNDLDGLMTAIHQACNPAERRARGAAALRFAKANFCMTDNCAHLAELLETAARSEPLPCLAAAPSPALETISQ